MYPPFNSSAGMNGGTRDKGTRGGTFGYARVFN